MVLGISLKVEKTAMIKTALQGNGRICLFGWLTFRQSKHLCCPNLSHSISLSLAEGVQLWKEQLTSLQCVTTVQVMYGLVPSDVTRLPFILQLHTGKDDNCAYVWTPLLMGIAH